MRSAKTALLREVCLNAVALTSGCLWDKKETAYVTEPFVKGTNIVRGFDLLREAGLRVSIAEPFTVGSLLSPARKAPRLTAGRGFQSARS